jgi:polyisoprenyl-teichoic acid--peptidoglycan teichoic acid transferase
MTRKKKIIIAIVSVFIVLLASIGVYAYKVYSDVTGTVDAIHEKVETEQVREKPVEVTEREPFSVLLLGVDNGDEGRTDSGRSDSLMVMTVNPKEKTTKLLSIPRDSRTEIVGKGFDDKINHAYAFGGVPMTINTVQKFLNVPIDYYVQVNMQGFKDIVDAVGGVDVNNAFEFTSRDATFAKGNIHLDGELALKYARMRYEDPNGDFGRQARHRQIITAVVKKAASLNTLVNYQDMLKAIEKNVKTNATFDEMMSIQADYKEAANNINEIQLYGEGKKIDGIYYQIVPQSARDKVSQELRTHLELK